MTTTGRIVVTVVAVAALIGATALATHYIWPSSEQPAASTSGGTGVGGQAAVASGAGGTPTGAAATATSAVAGASGAAGAMGQAGPGDAAAEDGLALAAGGRQVQAQARLSEAVQSGVGPAKAKVVREKLAALADQVQFSNQTVKDDPYSTLYTAASGDSLEAIGKKFVVPYELIMKINHLSAPRIAAGQSLKVVKGPVHVELYKSRYELLAWLGNVCVRAYPIAIGKSDTTPEGTFIVKSKMKDPPYQPQHKTKADFRASGAPDNPLGSRWIDIGNHYGIHGTIDPTSIGRDASEGCIRMHNKDVEELFDLVAPGASKVTIRP